MPATYEPIASTTVSGTPTEITFSSLPSGYTDLVCSYHCTANGAADVTVRFNGDTGTNYSATSLYANGSTVGSYRESSKTFILLDYWGSVSTSFGHNVFHVMSYSNTNVFKTVLSAPGRASSGVDRNVGLWRSTAAITSLSLVLFGATFTGGTVSLYGIKAA